MEKIEFSHAKRTRVKKKRRMDRLYEKKPAIEFIVAVLSVPSILLLLILNLRSLTTSNNAKPTPTPVNTNTNTTSMPTTNTNFFTRPVPHQSQPTAAPDVTQAPCIKGLGPVSITSPSEGESVSNNPVEVDVSYDDSTFCSAVWSYSVNGSSWSGYSNNSVALYNLPNGPIQFQLRVKSLTTSDSTTITRNFTFTGQSNAPIPTASSSAQ